MSKCRWLEPHLVAAVEFAEWTSANHLRHCKYIALREDKDPNDVVREVLAAEV
jgi:bifunctional non-homologous end joining protein LigD